MMETVRGIRLHSAVAGEGGVKLGAVFTTLAWRVVPETALPGLGKGQRANNSEEERIFLTWRRGDM